MSVRSFEFEVWTAALQLWRQFGPSAETEVSDLIDEANKAEDSEAVAIWGSVLRALTALREADGLMAN